MQVVAPDTAEYLPTSHAVQEGDEAMLYLPRPQLMQESAELAGSCFARLVPALQLLQNTCPSAS